MRKDKGSVSTRSVASEADGRGKSRGESTAQRSSGTDASVAAETGNATWSVGREEMRLNATFCGGQVPDPAVDAMGGGIAQASGNERLTPTRELGHLSRFISFLTIEPRVISDGHHTEGSDALARQEIDEAVRVETDDVAMMRATIDSRWVHTVEPEGHIQTESPGGKGPE